ncbi:MAG: twin-arginine translocase TatA/TatE family subunit [Caldimicrobium sp.]|nr:twin-arginine translocase TatA/TatE family subunit [Caldimicrobium sp.]MCX7612882.1 twin-arginine translocase TatA/TatE family subunit [Caldimicrobium sp.]MDW8183590.1 twin-arginine translocase TatA/TatE family subunit [Caldimicrobium sp.]
MPFGLGGQELFIILFLALLIFGAKKLPEIGAGLGKGIRSFRDTLKEADVSEDIKKLEENKKENKAEEKPAEAKKG